MSSPDDRAAKSRIEGLAHEWHDRTSVPWKEYVDAILKERELALHTATEEREKAAQAIRESTIRAINEGDDRLREHISNQFAQIAAALTSAEKLERARIEALRSELGEQIVAVRRELQAAAEAQKEAIVKAETATERRFESVNEWRGQSADRERSQQEQTLRLTSSFMPRELAEQQLSDIRDSLGRIAQMVNTNAGSELGRGEQITRLIAGSAVLVSIILVVLSIATHGFK